MMYRNSMVKQKCLKLRHTYSGTFWITPTHSTSIRLTRNHFDPPQLPLFPLKETFTERIGFRNEGSVRHKEAL